MAGAACAQLLGGSVRQIEYAAEMGLEHHLGLTCDPLMGLVQIPCIERNAMAAMRAIDHASYALMGDGRHKISFDDVVEVMMETGHALPSLYRETSMGGVLHFQSVNSSELLCVVSHKNKILCCGMCRDETIKRAYGRPSAFQINPNPSIFISCILIEVQYGYECHKAYERFCILISEPAFLDTIDKLCECYR